MPEIDGEQQHYEDDEKMSVEDNDGGDLDEVEELEEDDDEDLLNGGGGTTDKEFFDDEEFVVEEPGLPTVAVDGEGEIIYDINVARPDYKLFSLRNGSCIDYHSLIDFEENHISPSHDMVSHHDSLQSVPLPPHMQPF